MDAVKLVVQPLFLYLFHFLHDNIFYDDQEIVDMSFSGNVKLISDYTLSDLLKAKGDKMMMEYDFGDWWRHDVWVKGIRPYEKGEQQCVKFVKGQRACPPEDCGGVSGYEHLLEILQKKLKDAEEKEELRWYGMRRNYDPDAFDNEYGENVAEDYNLLMSE